MNFYEFSAYRNLFTSIGNWLKGDTDKVFEKKISTPIELVAKLYKISDRILDDMWTTTYQDDNNEKVYILLGFLKDDTALPIVENLMYQRKSVKIIILPAKEVFDNMTNEEVFNTISYISTILAFDENKRTVIEDANNYLLVSFFIFNAFATAYKLTESLADFLFKEFNVKEITMDTMQKLYHINKDEYEEYDYLTTEYILNFSYASLNESDSEK